MGSESSRRKRARNMNKRRDEDDEGKSETPFDRLPDECIQEIFSYNPDPADRWSCATVSKKWLILQAQMKRSYFKLEPPSPCNATTRFSRCLEGCNSVDTRLAAMVVAKFSRGKISSLSIRGDSLEYSPDSQKPHGVTDYGLHIVGSSFPHLKSLALWGCPQITSKGLAYMAQGCALLEKLDLCECPLLTDEGMVGVAILLSKLVTLSIDSCQNVGNGTLKAFGTYTSSLESISVVGCPFVGDEGIPTLVGGLPNLRRLRLARVSSKVSLVLEIVRHVKKLAYLSLDDLPCAIVGNRKSNPSDEHSLNVGPSGSCVVRFRAIGLQCLNLKSVYLSKCKPLDDDGLLGLARGAVALENLAIESCSGVSFYGLLELLCKHSQELKSLSLVKCKGIVEPSSWAVPVSPPSCNKLEALTVRHCPGIRDGFFEWLGRACQQLHEVELTGLCGISDKGLLSLVLGCGEGAPSLDRVYLSGCMGLTDVSVFCIASMCGEELKSLGLGDCEGVTNRCMEFIAACCPKLMDLHLPRCGIIVP